MSKSTNGLRKVGLASLAVTLTLGAGAMGAGSASALPGFSFDRIGGDNRYETSALIADEYEEGPIADVILANAQPGFYADALTANFLSGEMDAPILLTRKEFTPKPVLDQLEEDQVENITVVGGEGVVPEEQVKALEAEGYNVTRISGTDRFLTNAEVIKEGGAATNGVGVIATGFNFPDALAAGPISYNGHPLGLSTEDDIDDEVISALKGAGVTKVLIMGGVSAVGQAVVDKLEDNGITVLQRFAGADRSETSELAAEWALKNLGFTNKHVGVASGYTEGYGADALAGGPLEGMEKSPILITRNEEKPDDVLDYLEAHSDTLVDGHLFGGPSAITVAAEAEMEEAAQGTAPASATSLPELQTARVVSTTTTGNDTTANPVGTRVEYTFDEPLGLSGGLQPTNASKFRVYSAAGSQVLGSEIMSFSGSSVVVRFGSVATTADAQKLTVATVDDTAVRDTAGNYNPEGDAALGATSGGTPVTLPAGQTEAPDLLSVGNFRQASGTGNTAVDFTFDEAATVLTATGFKLHLLDGTVREGTASTTASEGGGTVAGGSGTTRITVIFNDGSPATGEQYTAADVARGTVNAGTVEEATNNETDATKDKNALQAAAVSAGGNTVYPDLVSVELRPGATVGAADRALFTFDQNVAEVAGTPDYTKFHLYYADGSTAASGVGGDVNNANPTQVLVDFGSTATDGAVGGNVDEAAVTPNGKQDEEGVANTTTSASQTAGKTDGPDLTGVALETATNLFGTVTGTEATYTFDEKVDLSDATKFHLYLANGTKVSAVAGDCEVGPDTTTDNDNNTVVCEFGGVSGDADREMEATLGTVDHAAVDEAGTGGLDNPEGAEHTTGGTGTPAA